MNSCMLSDCKGTIEIMVQKVDPGGQETKTLPACENFFKSPVGQTHRKGNMQPTLRLKRWSLESSESEIFKHINDCAQLWAPSKKAARW